MACYTYPGNTHICKLEELLRRHHRIGSNIDVLPLYNVGSNTVNRNGNINNYTTKSYELCFSNKHVNQTSWNTLMVHKYLDHSKISLQFFGSGVTEIPMIINDSTFHNLIDTSKRLQPYDQKCFILIMYMYFMIHRLYHNNIKNITVTPKSVTIVKNNGTSVNTIVIPKVAMIGAYNKMESLMTKLKSAYIPNNQPDQPYYPAVGNFKTLMFKILDRMYKLHIYLINPQNYNNSSFKYNTCVNN